MRTLTASLTFVLLSATSSAFAQPVTTCAVDPAHPELGAICETVNEAARVADVSPCEGPVSVGDVLALAASSPEHEPVVRALLGAFAKETGRTLSPAEVDALIRDPKRVEELMTVSIPEIVAGLKKAQAAADARGRQPAADPGYTLPNGVDLADAASYMDGTIDGAKPIAEGILRGDLPSDLSAGQVQSRRALGEILDRLSRNIGEPSANRFRVTYKGSSFSTVDGFLAALERNGNAITATVTQGVANFIDLRIQHPSGGTCEVKTPVMIKTGYRAADGTEITVPAVHSGMNFSFSGPDLDGVEVSFYQGVGGTKFFAAGLGKDQSWSGGHEVERFTGADARKAASGAAFWRDVVEELSQKDGLIGGGYGQTGVCNDSVALLQLMLTGRTTIYPLAMDHARVNAFLDEKIAAGGTLATKYARLKELVGTLPVDTQADPTQPGRILDSIPFGAGPTGYPGADAARETLRDNG